MDHGLKEAMKRFKKEAAPYDKAMVSIMQFNGRVELQLCFDKKTK